MTVTLKDVAKRAGVSIPTVSLIINGHNLPFKESTRRAVLEAVEELNYRPDSMARRSANGSNRRDAIALLLRSESRSRVANSPVYEFICGVNDVCMEHNQFLVMMKSSHFQQQGKEGARPRVIAERFVDGLIVETGLPPEMEMAIDRYRIPTIWLNCSHHDPQDCVYPDEVHAGRIITEHLIELGHRNILFLAPLSSRQPGAPFSTVDRQLGYEQTMTRHSLKPCVVIEDGTPDPGSASGSTFSDLTAAVKVVSDSRKSPEPITGIVTYDFSQAAKIRGELELAGISCPREISITTSNDLRFLRRVWPEITGVTCNRYQMACAAAEMMLAKIASGGQGQTSQVWQGELIRGSTATPPPPLKSKPKAKRDRTPKASES